MIDQSNNNKFSLTKVNANISEFMAGKLTYKVKIYNELIEALITNRKLRGQYCKTNREGYQTNRIIKPICTYFLLKSLTNSGYIRNYTAVYLLSFLQLSKATFYKHIKELETLNLVKRQGDSLKLASYEKMIEMFDLVIGTKNITTVNYSNKSKLHYLVYGSILYNWQKEINQTFENKIKCNPELLSSYKKQLSINTNETDFKIIQKELYNKQINDFKTLTNDELKNNFETELINPDSNVTARKIRQKFGFKSNKSVAFLKLQLSYYNIATIEKRKVISSNRCRKSYQYVEYNKEQNATIWHLPDNITLNKAIYV